MDIHVKKNNIGKGHIYIRFPEVVQGKQCRGGEVLDFYRDNRNPLYPGNFQCEPTKLPVDWQGNDKQLFYEMTFDNNLVLHSRATVVNNSRVSLEFQLDNNTEMDLVEMDIESCVQPQYIPDICDHRAERTMVLTNGTWQAFKDAIPNFQGLLAGRKEVGEYFHAFTNRDYCPEFTSKNVVDKHHAGRITRWWIVPSVIDIPVIATISKDGSWTVATSCELSLNVWHNPALSCHHADIAIPECKAGQSIKGEMVIHVVSGGMDGLTKEFSISGD